MGLFEWMGESVDPRSWGSVTFGGEPDDEESSIPGMIVRFVIAMCLLTAVYYLLFRFLLPFTWICAAWVTGLTLAYLLVGYYVRPEPETDNLGWFGGLIDDPFHYSDDISRFLLLLAIVLYPARFIAVSAVQFIRILRR